MHQQLVKMFGIVCLGTFSSVPHQASLKDLQARLDAAFSDDEPIVLSQGTSFSSKPGTLIFLSEELGKKEMLKHVQGPELSMLFLPRWCAWITETLVRSNDQAKVDNRYLVSALASGIEAERWHTHDDIGENQKSAQWIVPSSADLLQVLGFKKLFPRSEFKGVIVSRYGTLSFERWPTVERNESEVITEAYTLYLEASEISPLQLQSLAHNHRGFALLRFEPFSK
ncbi:MAG: hypothetical protein KW793_03250 [Candidatus Doudnabacteria bacterium]|nr:hypothetical protein [Candidatus Doudnabacteria bacterium]